MIHERRMWYDNPKNLELRTYIYHNKLERSIMMNQVLKVKKKKIKSKYRTKKNGSSKHRLMVGATSRTEIF